MKSAAKNIQLASYDDLFKTDEERLEQVVIAGELDVFRGTFHVPAPPS